MKQRWTGLILWLLVAACEGDIENREQLFERLRQNAAPEASEWRHYLGGADSRQYSALSQVHRGNVHQLVPAWTYDPGGAGGMDTQIPTNPLVVNGVLYGLDARKNLFALDAATGEELWVYPFDTNAGGKGAGRGLVYWEGEDSHGQFSRRLLVGIEHRLWAIDAVSGQPVPGFGSSGHVDLRRGLERDPDTLSVSVTSPGTVFRDLLIQGFATSEARGGAPGFVRAYHIPSGELRWTFRTIPAPGETGGDSWGSADRFSIGGANAWAGISIDTERGIAFVPTGSPSGDFVGSDRPGDNLFANTLLALDAGTGKRLWHFQVVRHDLWDRDLPSPPNLIDIERDGRRIPAVSQATKTGHLFVFNRETGDPLFRVTEVAVTGPGLPGESPALTQPLPLSPPPFAEQQFRVTNLSDQSARYVLSRLQGMQMQGPYSAPDAAGQVLYPGFDGGASWGGQSWDPDARLLYVNAIEVPSHFSMVPVEQALQEYSLQNAYLMFCASCHGSDRRGSGEAFPGLQNIGERLWPWETYRLIRQGRGRMPGFAEYPWYLAAGLTWYLYTTDEDPLLSPAAGGDSGTWHFNGYNTVQDADGLPGSRPPWGTLNAVDLDSGGIAWRVPLGDYPSAMARGLTGLGAANYGGPVATAGGLLFIAATPDRKIRAFDKITGEVLWEATLPAAGFATPAVYEAGGRQFVVIAAGGGKLGQPSGSSYHAFALPEQQTEPAGTH